MLRIVDGVYRITSGIVSAYAIDGDEGVTLVDTLVAKRESLIMRSLAEMGRSISDVSAIVLTHGHEDHFGSAAAVKDASGAAVYASAGEVGAIRGEIRPPLPPVWDSLPFLKPILRLFPTPPPVAVDYVIGEGVDGRLPEDLRVIDTPGHSPGHISFLLDRDGGLLVVGDAAVARKGEVARGWFNRATPTIDASLQHISEFEFATAVFGHSGPIQSGAAAAFRRFAAVQQTNDA